MAENELAISAYELRAVYVEQEILYARPTEWDDRDETGFGENKYGRTISATKWETACPNCGNLISFGSDEVYGENNIICQTCKAGEIIVGHNNAIRIRDEILKEQELSFQQFSPEKEVTEPKIAINTVFCNPIELGRMIIKLNDDAQ